MSSSTSGPTSSEAALAADAERLSPGYRGRVYGRGLLLIWTGVLGGPIVWALDQQVAYWLVYRSCHSQSLAWLYVETAVALLAAAACTWVALRVLRTFPEASLDGGHADDRTRFLGLVGLGLGAISLLTIAASAIPRFILDPCP